jgi:pimeloyl-ACP methyl ester carboxylesterase
MSLFFGLLAPLLLTLPDPGLAQDATFDSAGVSIRYVEAGTGETTIVLLHGFAANADLFALDGMLVVLATRWRVVALDARGHGRSDKPHEPAAYGREMTEDVVRLLDHLGVQRAHVLGYSMGGMLALDLLTRHPERVLSAVVGGCGLPEPAVHGALMESVARALDAGAGFQPLVARLAAGTRVPPSPERLAVLERALLAANDPRALAAVARGFEQLLPAEASLRANTVPTLAVVGTLDPLMPDVVRLRRTMARLEIVLVDGTDHMSTARAPAFLAAARRFFAASRSGEWGRSREARSARAGE